MAASFNFNQEMNPNAFGRTGGPRNEIGRPRKSPRIGSFADSHEFDSKDRFTIELI